MFKIDTNNKEQLKCNFCTKIISEGRFRMKNHLAGMHTDVATFPQVLESVKSIFLEKLQKRDMENDLFKEVDVISGSRSNTVKKGSLDTFVQRGHIIG